MASRERVGAAAALHRGNGDGPAGAEWPDCAADQIEITHAIKLLIVCHADRAIAVADLGAEIDVDFGAAVGRFAPECFALAPLIHEERPLHFGPDRVGRTQYRDVFAR